MRYLRQLYTIEKTILTLVLLDHTTNNNVVNSVAETTETRLKVERGDTVRNMGKCFHRYLFCPDLEMFGAVYKAEGKNTSYGF